MEKELILKLTDKLISIFELNDLQDQKIKAVKAQDYELCCKLRGIEKEKIAACPTIEEMKKLRDELAAL